MAGQPAPPLLVLWRLPHQPPVGADRRSLRPGVRTEGVSQIQQKANPNEVNRTVAEVITHPDYKGQTNENDIALLKLSSPVAFTAYIAPVCLAASGSTFYDGVDCWVTGWGNIAFGVLPYPQNLQEVKVPIVGNRQCQCNYGQYKISEDMVCAGLKQGGKDACQLDSGGPLVSKQGSRWIQAGLVSFGEGCALPNFPGVYTRVSQYQTWINSQITSDQPGFITFSSTGTNSDLSVSGGHQARFPLCLCLLLLFLVFPKFS
uniref:Peptidase S1 domain-containing protein n=1 Tax=Oryzias melastigma TaxID=30732 RepID=A0A3B3DN57_ORYME